MIPMVGSLGPDVNPYLTSNGGCDGGSSAVAAAPSVIQSLVPTPSGGALSRDSSQAIASLKQLAKNPIIWVLLAILVLVSLGRRSK